MYKYYDFKKIYEAEQMGEALKSEKMGIESIEKTEITSEQAGSQISEVSNDGFEKSQSELTQPKKIMSFDQFINEGKKDEGNWIADVVKDMKKGALKKEMGGKVTKAKIAKKEAELKKKDKDKKKPGLQLNSKDAKTHKRDILALNLLKAQKGKK